MITKRKQGFTLIEILIVVAIIAVLASVVLVGIGPTQRAGRDARRISDLQQVQNGLVLFNNKCGYFPGTGTGGACASAAATTWDNMSTALTSAGIGVNSVPRDPTSATPYLYHYRTNFSAVAPTNPGTSYLLGATLEDSNNAVFTSYRAPIITSYVSGDDAITCATPNYCVTL